MEGTREPLPSSYMPTDWTEEWDTGFPSWFDRESDDQCNLDPTTEGSHVGTGPTSCFQSSPNPPSCRQLDVSSIQQQDFTPGYPLHPANPISLTRSQISSDTTQRFHDFINETNGGLHVTGSSTALYLLRSTLSGIAKVQRLFLNGPYGAYFPLQTAMRHLCLKFGIPCPSAQQLCVLHRSPEYRVELEMVCYEAGITTSLDYVMDTNAMVAMLRLFGRQAFQMSGNRLFHQLGVITAKHGMLEARLYTNWNEDASGTVWLYFETTAYENAQGVWYGLCSDEALELPTYTENFTHTDSLPPTQVPITPQSHRDIERDTLETIMPTQMTPTKPSKRKADASVGEGPRKSKKRRTATPITELRVDCPANFAPNQIIDQHERLLHYNNLLRVAAWYTNKDIFDRMNHHKSLDNEPIFKAASCVAKRIVVACSYTADQHGIPPDVFRYAFDNMRKQNGINTRDGYSPDMAANAAQYHEQLTAALDKVTSGSAVTGLVKQPQVNQLNPTVIPSTPLSLQNPITIFNAQLGIHTPDRTPGHHSPFAADTPIGQTIPDTRFIDDIYGPQSDAMGYPQYPQTFEDLLQELSNGTSSEPGNGYPSNEFDIGRSPSRASGSFYPDNCIPPPSPFQMSGTDGGFEWNHGESTTSDLFEGGWAALQDSRMNHLNPFVAENSSQELDLDSGFVSAQHPTMDKIQRRI